MIGPACPKNDDISALLSDLAICDYMLIVIVCL